MAEKSRPGQHRMAGRAAGQMAAQAGQAAGQAAAEARTQAAGEARLGEPGGARSRGDARDGADAHRDGAGDPRSVFRPLEADQETFGRLQKTAQTASPSYRLAVDDPDFLRLPELRGARLQLEYQKVEHILQEIGVRSTVILFGGARIPAPGAPARAATPEIAANLEACSAFYEEARRFARLASAESLRWDGREFVVATGGGPGVMEAGNRGAEDVGAASLGFGIVLPHEDIPNAHVTPELCFNFHYFAIRKMHFLLRAKAIAVFPGGFGTLDELFEVLTLVQTKRMARLPILLFGSAFWSKIVNFEALAEAGTIAPKDLELFRHVETADEAWEVIRREYDLPADAAGPAVSD